MEKQLSSIETDNSITRLKVSQVGESGILFKFVDYKKFAIDPNSRADKPKYVYEIEDNEGTHWYVSVNGNTHGFAQAHAKEWVLGSLHRIYAKTMEGYDFPFFAVDFCEVVPGEAPKARAQTTAAQPASTTKQKRGDNVAWAITGAIAGYPIWIVGAGAEMQSKSYLEQIDALAEELEKMHERRMLFPNQ